MSEATTPADSHAAAVWHCAETNSRVLARYLSKRLRSWVASACRRLARYAATVGAHPRSLALTKMTPARETVAGDALRRSSTSICSVTFGRSIGMRSLLARVRILLSSITVFMFSIHIASTGPSSTSHVKFFLSLFALRHSCEKMPSVHSPSSRESEPNICGAVIAFGFSRNERCGWPTSGGTPWPGVAASSALWSTSTMRVLPVPDGPTTMSEWRTSAISYTCTILARQSAWRCRSSAAMDLSIAVSIVACDARAALTPGKRSSMSERKSGTSSATNLERFMSRSVRISRLASGVDALTRLELPAVRRTARMLRRPKS